MNDLAKSVHSFGISLGLSTGLDGFRKLSPLYVASKAVFHTWFEGHQVVEIKVENTLFHR
jgi:hypothetical protein